MFETERAMVEPEEALVLIKNDDGMAFSQVNPFLIKQEIDLKIKSVHSAKPLRAGALLVRTVSAEQTKKLLQIKTFLGRPVQAELADHLNTVEAVAYAPSLQEIPEQQLVSELQDQGVVGVYKHKARPDGGQSHLVRFRFRGLAYPESITVGYEVLKLRLWIKPPALCRRCAKYGHTIRNCTSTNLRCLRCAEEHLTQDCQASRSFCPHCRGPHAAWEHCCPTLRDQMARAEEAQQESAGPPLPPRRPALREALDAARLSDRRRHRTGTPPPTAPPTTTCGSQTTEETRTVATQAGPPKGASVGAQTERSTQEASTQTDPAVVISASTPASAPAAAAAALPPSSGEGVPSAQRPAATPQPIETAFSPLQTRGQRAQRAEELREKKLEPLPPPPWLRTEESERYQSFTPPPRFTPSWRPSYNPRYDWRNYQSPTPRDPY